MVLVYSFGIDKHYGTSSWLSSIESPKAKGLILHFCLYKTLRRQMWSLLREISCFETLKLSLEVRLVSSKLLFTQIILTKRLECQNLRQILSLQWGILWFEAFETRHQSKLVASKLSFTDCINRVRYKAIFAMQSIM